MPRDKIVLRMSNDEIYNCHALHADQYTLDNSSRYFDILNMADLAHSQYQLAVIMLPNP